MIPFVLIHGGTFDGRCWDLLTPHLDGPVLAVDLPGRGKHAVPLDEVNLEACADAVVADIEEAGYDEVVVVGHSMAGITMPGVIGRLGDRVRHAAFVACTVPPDSGTILDTLDPSIGDMARENTSAEPALPSPEVTALVLGDDLTRDQLQWCSDRMVPEAIRLISEPVDLSPLKAPVPRIWVRTLGDRILDPAKQLAFARNVGDCPVVDVDAGHMCMVSKPEELAAILNQLGGVTRAHE